MRKCLVVLSVIFILLAGAAPALAVPTLQLYMPDAAYYSVNPWFPESGESWVTTQNPFELRVAGATTPPWVKKIENVTLHIALLQSEYLANQIAPIMTIKDNDPNINFEKTIYASEFLFGKPSGVSPHGIYDTYYASIHLPDLLVKTADETVYDYNKDFDPAHPELSDSDSGDIQYYFVDYDPRFTFIHFDLTGTIGAGENAQGRFAPYSHDAHTATPEPASLALLGFGLAGLVASLRRKKV